MLHKSYEVWLKVDGERLPEYNLEMEGDDQKTAACYVPSERGKHFAIHWRDHKATDYLSLEFTIDGTRLRSAQYCDPGKTGFKADVRRDAEYTHPLMFSDLQITDGEDAFQPTAALGTIVVSVTRMNPPQLVPRGDWHVRGEDFHGVGVVHETSKKAGTHGVSLGEAQFKPKRLDRNRNKMRRKNTPVDRGEGAVARFVFRYKPYDLLQAQSIVPPPVPSLSLVALPDTPLATTASVTQNRALKRPPSSERPPKRPRGDPGHTVDQSPISDVLDDDDELDSYRYVVCSCAESNLSRCHAPY
ncbi:uncharacterized protein BXZ73DRAFT_41913 [Epithele typhae]|uniref:uncharacterized protein n=1 Tax=Epithele typhae TaxID=378194 RepID=UPI002008851F|nr:uncharacterized protein BXZ73DRAFT_41913 [Epithele typhae]KAH9941713.1 hypothetical protein BXZ73DRAFT_41913 [Epithele typhae]